MIWNLKSDADGQLDIRKWEVANEILSREPRMDHVTGKTISTQSRGVSSAWRGVDPWFSFPRISQSPISFSPSRRPISRFRPILSPSVSFWRRSLYFLDHLPLIRYILSFSLYISMCIIAYVLVLVCSLLVFKWTKEVICNSKQIEVVVSFPILFHQSKSGKTTVFTSWVMILFRGPLH